MNFDDWDIFVNMKDGLWFVASTYNTSLQNKNKNNIEQNLVSRLILIGLVAFDCRFNLTSLNADSLKFF